MNQGTRDGNGLEKIIRMLYTPTSWHLKNNRVRCTERIYCIRGKKNNEARPLIDTIKLVNVRMDVMKDKNFVGMSFCLAVTYLQRPRFKSWPERVSYLFNKE